MKHSTMLTVSSLLSTLLFSIHVADDVVRGIDFEIAEQQTIGRYSRHEPQNSYDDGHDAECDGDVF